MTYAQTKTNYHVCYNHIGMVGLTDESEAYLISVTKANGEPEAELFKLDAKYLRGREDFFNAVMDAWRKAEKLPIRKVFELKVVNMDEIIEVSDIIKSRSHD